MPDRPKIVIVDTTPIVSLSLIQQLQLLELLYGEVMIPSAVADEVVAGGTRAGAAELRMASYIRIVPLVDPQRATLLYSAAAHNNIFTRV